MITIEDYYKKFRSIFGAVTGAIGVLPLISGLFPEKWASYLFPPLGNIWRLVAATLAGLVTLALFYAKDLDAAVSKKGRLQLLIRPLLLAVIGAVAFLIVDNRFVRTVEIPSLDKNVSVIVGFERTSFASSNFPQASDWELLRQRGLSDEQIHELWTGTSILVARLLLFASYALFLLPAISTGCFAVLFDVLGPPTAP